MFQKLGNSPTAETLKRELAEQRIAMLRSTKRNRRGKGTRRPIFDSGLAKSPRLPKPPKERIPVAPSVRKGRMVHIHGVGITRQSRHGKVTQY